MIEGKSIRLRAWRESDLLTLISLRNDIALQAQLLARARGGHVAQVREWLTRRVSQANALFFIIADKKDDNPLGYIQISEMELTDRRGELGICLVKETRGRGYGSEAIKLASEYLRSTWNLQKLSLKVRADNAPALRCYEKVGFQRCGLLKRHFCIEERWHDVVLMEYFLSEEV